MRSWPPLQQGLLYLETPEQVVPPVPEHRDLSEIICVQTARTHLLTGSHKRSCRTATRLPGRGRWPRNRRSAQEREEREFLGRGPTTPAVCFSSLCLFPVLTVVGRELMESPDPNSSFSLSCVEMRSWPQVSQLGRRSGLAARPPGLYLSALLALGHFSAHVQVHVSTELGPSHYLAYTLLILG